MITLQDRYIGITKIEKALHYINDDKKTCVCASDIAQFIDEYYPEMFEGIASDDVVYSFFNYRIETMRYYSFKELVIDFLADNENLNAYNANQVLALNHGYDTFEEMKNDYLIICDCAIDGYLVFE